MLPITRKKHESIIIGNDIELVIVEIREDKVRIGIKMPEGGSVHRGEVIEYLKSREQTPPSS